MLREANLTDGIPDRSLGPSILSSKDSIEAPVKYGASSWVELASLNKSIRYG